MSEDLMLKCLIVFVLGFLLLHMMKGKCISYGCVRKPIGNGFRVSAVTQEEVVTEHRYTDLIVLLRREFGRVMEGSESIEKLVSKISPIHNAALIAIAYDKDFMRSKLQHLVELKILGKKQNGKYKLGTKFHDVRLTGSLGQKIMPLALPHLNKDTTIQQLQQIETFTVGAGFMDWVEDNAKVLTEVAPGGVGLVAAAVGMACTGPVGAVLVGAGAVGGATSAIITAVDD